MASSTGTVKRNIELKVSLIKYAGNCPGIGVREFMGVFK